MAKVADEMDQARGAMDERQGKYLTFTLDKVEYGIGISKISEIIGMIPVTSVPRTPDFVKGVINLRGKVIPVVDLRLRVGMEEIEYTERTCIIVVEIAARAVTVMIGIVVDAVSEVLNIKAEDIEDTPTFGTKLSTNFILGMAKMGGGVKILLDIDRVLSQEELELVSRVEREDSRVQAEAKPKKTAALKASPKKTAVGKSPEACVGQKCFNLFNTEHCNTPDCQVAKAMQQDGVFTSETRASLPSGELAIRYTGAPLQDDKGDIVGGLALVLDISRAMEVTEAMMDLARSSLSRQAGGAGQKQNSISFQKPICYECAVCLPSRLCLAHKESPIRRSILLWGIEACVVWLKGP